MLNDEIRNETVGYIQIGEKTYFIQIIEHQFPLLIPKETRWIDKDTGLIVRTTIG
jgi:hypothetical protein